MRQFTYTLTYEVVTPESAERGDTADHGFGDPDDLGCYSIPELEQEELSWDEFRARLADAEAAATWNLDPEDEEEDEEGQDDTRHLRAAVRILRHYGAQEPSQDPVGEGAWFVCSAREDYRTGEHTTLHLHLDGFTGSELARIWAMYCDR